MKLSKQKLTNDLYKFLDNIEIDSYNDSTFNWSRGYQKAIQDIIEMIEKNEGVTNV